MFCALRYPVKEERETSSVITRISTSRVVEGGGRVNALGTDIWKPQSGSDEIIIIRYFKE